MKSRCSLRPGTGAFSNTPGSVDRSSRRCEAGGVGGERRSRPAMMRVKAAVAEDGKINEGMALRKAEEAGECCCRLPVILAPSVSLLCCVACVRAAECFACVGASVFGLAGGARSSDVFHLARGALARLRLVTALVSSASRTALQLTHCLPKWYGVGACKERWTSLP
jgi:hypothetical protein